MKTQIIKWDESMAVRCLARYHDEVRAKNPHTVHKDNPAEAELAKWVLKTAPAPKKEKSYSVNVAKGEWDDFEYAISNSLKKRHK